MSLKGCFALKGYAADGLKSWRRISRQSQVLGCTPVWRLMLGAGMWPSRMLLPSKRFKV